MTIGSISAGGSVDDGNHYYRVTFVTAEGETTTSTTTSAVATTGGGNNTVNLTGIPVSPVLAVTARKLPDQGWRLDVLAASHHRRQHSDNVHRHGGWPRGEINMSGIAKHTATGQRLAGPIGFCWSQGVVSRLGLQALAN